MMSRLYAGAEWQCQGESGRKKTNSPDRDENYEKKEMEKKI